MRLWLEKYNQLQIHLFSETKGVTLVYLEGERNRWNAYSTQRDVDGKRPRQFVLATNDAERAYRTKLQVGGPVDLRLSEGEVILTRGDLVLLRCPFAGELKDVFFEGRATVLGIDLVASEPVQADANEITEHLFRPEGLDWTTQLDAKAQVIRTDEGAIELRVDHAEQRGWMTAELPNFGPSEIVLELSQLSPGTGIFLADRHMIPSGVLRLLNHRRDGRLIVQFRSADDLYEHDLGTVVTRSIPYAGQRLFVKFVRGCGILRWWMSVDGENWAEPNLPFHQPYPDANFIGLFHIGKYPNCQLRLDNLSIRPLNALNQLVPEELSIRAQSFATSKTRDQWTARMRESVPADVAVADWARACTLKTIGAGCGRDLGHSLVESLLWDERRLPFDFERRRRILDELSLLVDLTPSADVMKYWKLQYLQLGRDAWAENGTPPYSSIRRVLMESPFRTSHGYDLSDPGGAQADLKILVHQRKLNELRRVCAEYQYFHLEKQLTLLGLGQCIECIGRIWNF